jgi:hypothetical protein
LAHTSGKCGLKIAVAGQDGSGDQDRPRLMAAEISGGGPELPMQVV